MAHFAKIESGIVSRVEVVANAVITDEHGVEQEQLGIDFLRGLYGEPDAEWVQCSYSAGFRGHFPGVGWTWDAGRNAFYPPQPFPSWSLNETTLLWDAPVAHPGDGKMYSWDEASESWVEV